MAYTLDPTKIQIVPEAGGFTIKIPGTAISGTPDPVLPPPAPPPAGQSAFKVGVTNDAPAPVVVPFGGSDLSVFAKAAPASPVNIKFPSGTVYGVIGVGKDINGNPSLTTAQNVAPVDAQWGTKFSVTTDPVSAGLPPQPPPTVPPEPNQPPPQPPPVSGAGKRSGVLGIYTFPNPGTGQKNPTFDEEFDQFCTELNAVPKFQNTFVDQSSQTQQDGSQYWWSNPMRADPRTKPGKIIPVAGVISSNSWDGRVRETQMRDVIAGKYDRNYVNAVQIWRDAGYTELCLRIDWEMNGTFMPWNWVDTNKQPLLDAGIGAFRHIHSCAQSVSGIKVWSEWNPCSQGWLWTGDEALWPGDDLQNIIMALDIYSFVGWKFGGPDSRLKSWAADVNNRIQYWDHPGSFGLADHLAHAAKRNRPWSLCETGVGYNPNAPDAGLDDDPAFVHYLAQRFDAAKTPCKHINIWSLDPGDGRWNFLRGVKPLTAAAWRQEFGGG